MAHQNIFDCDLLIIDDLGTEMSNSFTTSQFFLCLNERLLRGKSTIISTNLNMNQLADIYSERTFFPRYFQLHVLKVPMVTTSASKEKAALTLLSLDAASIEINAKQFILRRNLFMSDDKRNLNHSKEALDSSGAAKSSAKKWTTIW